MSAVRFVFAILIFCVALLAFPTAPNLFFWQIKLAATECGHWLVLAPLVVILAGRRRAMLDSISVGLAVLAAIVFLSSGVRAMLYASTAKSKMDAVFPAPAGAVKSAPFSWLAQWRTSGPAHVEVQTIEFTEHSGSPLKLDFYPAQGRQPAPCLVVVHGGGWNHSDRTEFAGLNHHLAQRGYAVAAVDYRLAPRWTWPAQREDVLAALGYLRTHAGELGLDAGRFVLLGRSAGGQIAEAITARADHPELVGCIALYAPADMRFAFQFARHTDIVDSAKLLREYLGGTPAEVPGNYEGATANGLANPKTPPTLLLHGANDELVWMQQSQRYADRLRTCEVRNVFLKLPWATHAFDYTLHGPGGQFATWAIERFLASVTLP